MAERTFRLYKKLGRSGIVQLSTSSPERSKLLAAEARTEQLYEHIEQLLASSDKDNAGLQQALVELNHALEREAEALEPILMKRLPGIEATAHVSKRADELIAKYGEDPTR